MGQKLSELELEYAKKWAQGKLTLNASFTTLTFGELSANDHKLLGAYCRIIP